MTISSLAAMHPKSLDLNPRMFAYGGVYICGMGAVLGISDILGFTKIRKDIDFYFRQPEEMGKIFVVGRFVNVIFSLLTMLVVFLLARKCFNVNTAVLSVLFYAVCPAIIFQSHIMKPYIIANFFALLSLYYSIMLAQDDTTEPHRLKSVEPPSSANASPKHPPQSIGGLPFSHLSSDIVRGIQRRRAKNYILAGLFAGLSAATTPAYALIIIAPLTAFIITQNKSALNLLYGLLAGTLIFFITNPYWLINCKEVLQEMLASGKFYRAGGGGTFLIFFVSQLPQALPSGLLFICIAGLVYAGFLWRKRDVIFIFSIIIPLVIFGWLTKNQELSMHNTRFLLPWLTMLLIIGARFVDSLLRNSYVKPIIILLVFVCFIQVSMASAICTDNFVMDSSSNSTRLQAGKWINSNIPAKSVIGTNNMPEPAHFPPFNFSNYKIVILRNYSIKQWPEYYVCIDKVPQEIANNPNYALIQSFRPQDTIYGFKFNMGYTHVNSAVTIFKQIHK